MDTEERIRCLEMELAEISVLVQHIVEHGTTDEPASGSSHAMVHPRAHETKPPRDAWHAPSPKPEHCLRW
jgi:hypothetical protein